MKALFLFLFTLSVARVLAQDFEGQITYQNSYKSKIPNVTDEHWDKMLGTKQEYIIKGGDYKSTVNGALLQWQLYRNKENKLYTKVSNSETLYWNDGAENKDEISDSKFTRNALEILGNMCDELVLTCKTGIQKYYFNSKYKVDPSLFVNHKFGNWYAYLLKAESLPLKQIVETQQFIFESTAIAIKPMQIDSKIFDLPADAKTMKSPE